MAHLATPPECGVESPQQVPLNGKALTPIVPPVVEEPGLAAGIRADPERLLARCAEEHGDVFTIVVGHGHRITYVLDPHAVWPLLTSPHVDFSPVSRQSKLRFGLGQMVSTNERVRSLSLALTGGLRGSQLVETLALFDAELERRVALYASTLGDERSRTIQSISQQTLMPATVCALFGGGVFDDQFISAFLDYSSSVSTRFAGSEPTLGAQGVLSERSLMRRLAGGLERQDTPVLMALSERLLDDDAVSNEERLRTLLMLMWGSMVNLVPTSVWMYASVVAEKGLVDELRTGFESGEGAPLRRSIVTETLRLFSRPNMYRAIVADFDLELSDDRKIRFTQGDWIALFPRMLHHDPDVFQEPHHFDARRFCPGEGDVTGGRTFHKNGEPLRHSTVVFGFGKGRCPGDAYSQAVLERILVAWTSAFDAQLAEPHLPAAITDTVSSTPGPASDIDVLVRPTRWRLSQP